MSEHFVWGIKDSFLQYVNALPDGSITASNGAILTPKNVFHFPLTTSTSDKFESSGEISIHGHHGMLDVTFHHLTVTLEQDKAVISVQVKGRSMKIARGHVIHHTPEEIVISTQVTTMGSELLGGVYQAGTDMDPLTIHLNSEG
ncbi:hypothetical protein N24_0157 [Corynebacterium suranareeae]|uniref:Htaa domain-containing protein n=1 Tax=Corynebacterium suranareeae TaxID=2506452 RepID=A0A160PL95_9CORY|nr:HtaA domain-containing protein [Corynebacterium suranareeae]BAU94419.1 hypothetical protein N24_0157 [Corynebacterium suranareeae]